MTEKTIRLDIGCGGKKKEGFIGVDQYAMEGVDVVFNVVERAADGKYVVWPWEDNSVDEIHSSHFLEHLDLNSRSPERVHFMNEACRIMKPGAKMTIITPHWASNRAYGDFTHADKPVSEMFYYYLNQTWRDANAPHTDVKWNPAGYSCNLAATWGYSYSPDLGARHADHVQFALQNYKEAAQDLYATLVKPVTTVE